MSDNQIDGVGRFLARAEDETPEMLLSWIGSIWGAVVSLLIFAAGVALLPVVWGVPTRLVRGIPLAVVIIAVTFFKRHRLARHFERSRKLLHSTDAETRNRGLVELMINARRGTGEHKRIAIALVEFVERCVPDDGLRKVAMTVLKDGTLKLGATDGIMIPER